MVQKTQKNRAGKPPSQRQLRVGEQVRHIISNTLFRGDIYDADLNAATISITQVSVSPDLKNATAYFVVSNGNTETTETIGKALNRNAKTFNRTVAKRVHIRTHPKIKFTADTSFEYARHIDMLLDKNKKC